MPPSLKVADVVGAMEIIAPTHLAQSWDNVGLLVGDPAAPATTALLTIDYTPAVAKEAAARACEIVIAYHPPIFKPLKKIDSTGLIHDALRRGIALYSPHTALDIVEGGTNDALADVIDLTDRKPLKPLERSIDQLKLVVFIPTGDVDRVCQALFSAGAGTLGNYSSCSFRSAGTGTFLPLDGANPAIGSIGKLERVDEQRIEMFVPIAQLADVVSALRAAHPYEEPAFDLFPLAAEPSTLGIGRIGSLPNVERSELIAQIKRGLAVSHLLIAGPTDGPVNRAAVCAGSCGDHLEDAIRAGAQFYLTGEMRHHDAVRAAAAGMTVVCTLHSNSERLVLPALSRKLTERLPALRCIVSEVDRDPFVIL